MVEFRYREIVGIFISLSLLTTIIFGLGVFLGKESTKFSLKIEKENFKNNVGVLIGEVEKQESQISPKVEEPKSELASAVPSQKPLEGFTIQVQIFDEEAIAYEERDRWLTQGFPSVFVRALTLEDYKWYVVDVGYFKEKETAVQFAAKLQSQGKIGAYWIRRSSAPDIKESS